MPFDYEHNSGPFTDGEGRAPARLVLRQVGDNEFALLEDLRYDHDGDAVEISTAELQRTNLATIPTWLGWFMRRHGRHTAAALMHDQQVGESSGRRVPYEERVAADRRFRLALRASGVPPSRSACFFIAGRTAEERPGGRLSARLLHCPTCPTGSETPMRGDGKGRRNCIFL